MAAAPLDGRDAPGPAQSGILDHRGVPFRETGDEFALPHVWTFGGLMGQAWRAYWHEGWDEARKHAHVDAQAMEQDCGLMGLLQERKLAVASLPWHLEVPDDKDPEQVKVRDALATAVQGIRGFRQLLMCLLDAIWYGRHAAQVRWRWTWNDGERVLTPCAWRPVRGDKIGHKWSGEPYVMILPHVANEIRDAEVINTTAGGRGLVLRGPWRERFLIHRHELIDADFLDLSGAEAIHGVGVRSRVFWLDWLKRKWLANVTEYMERVGLGVELWFFDPSNPRSKTETERAAKEQTGSRTRLLVPRWGADRQPGLERVEVPTSGAEFLRKLIEHVEELQERYIVGQSMSASAKGGAGGLGNEAAADFQRDTKDQVRNYDATNLAEVALTGDEDEPGLLSIMQRWSFPDTIPSEDNKEGFWVKFRFSLEHMESVEKLQSVSVVTGLGLPVKQDEIYSLAGLTRPDPGDDVVEGIREDPNATGGEGGGGGNGKPKGDGDGNGDGDGKTWTAEHGPKGGHHLVNKATGHSQPLKGGRKVPFSREGQLERFSGEWVTVGGHAEDGEKHVGGHPVKLDGHETKQPWEMTGAEFKAATEPGARLPIPQGGTFSANDRTAYRAVTGKEHPGDYAARWFARHQEEFIQETHKHGGSVAVHRAALRQALADRKRIPPEVLAEHPDLEHEQHSRPGAPERFAAHDVSGEPRDALGRWADAVHAVAREVPDALGGHTNPGDLPSHQSHKPLVADVWEHAKATGRAETLAGEGGLLSDFKERLMQAHQAGRLTLGINDLPQMVLPPGAGHARRNRSQVTHPLGEEYGVFHTIDTNGPAAHSRHARAGEPERFAAAAPPVVVNVPAPVVNVTLPESVVNVPAPVVNVTLPEPESQPAPVVNVTVPAPGPTVSTREVQYDEKGRVARTVTTEVPERPAQEPPA